MATTKDEPLMYVHLSDLATHLNLHPHAVEKCMFLGIFSADAQIKRGRRIQPIFLQSRIGEYFKAIRKYRDSISMELEPASR